MIMFGVLLSVSSFAEYVFLCISMIDPGNKYTTCFSSVVMMHFKVVYIREVLKIFRYVTFNKFVTKFVLLQFGNVV